jgi:hypothetical protein
MFLWVWTLGLTFGGFTLCPAKDTTYYILLAIYFQPISLDSQQSSATQSHGLSTWTAKRLLECNQKGYQELL